MTTAQIADVVIFNLAAIVGLTLGIKERRAMNGGSLTFGDGLITGITIVVTYAILTKCLFRNSARHSWSKAYATGR